MHHSCEACGVMYEPHTDRTTQCTVCTRFNSLVSNASRTRRDGSAPGVSITLQDFAVWLTGSPMRCAYCGVPEHLVEHLGLRTQVDQPLARLGVDRVDTRLPYSSTNMVLCCFACNKAKSNTFSEEEMRLVGSGIARAWQERLASVGVEWVPEQQATDTTAGTPVSDR